MSIKKTVLTLGALFALVPAAASAQDAATTYLDFQVEKPAKVKISVAPSYPERLLSAKVEGEVLVQFVVDEKGVADMGSFKVIRSTNTEFTDAVKRAVRSTTFVPAEHSGRKVRQIVQQPYAFSVR
jgi:protein TonB